MCLRAPLRDQKFPITKNQCGGNLDTLPMADF
jgi:hypothetical protein